ncbi:MAG: hypothetical protein PHE17_21080 [Thiothrix sp.]|uniref:type IV pilus modification PilV family protein n=1 Tax=Thiothrix sp. TaxID=1032 RepID=UPI002629BE55|nr:hypothetical protein [Thiothrix sp.]MDD5395525.1 hypothetical protein [Thiothrix sp.]
MPLLPLIKNLSRQSGSMLLEGLIAILIFSMGILALVGMQAASIKNTSDAKSRADASYLANQIIGQIWADRPNIASYSNYPSGIPCNPTGAASTNANVVAWIGSVSQPGTVLGSLPGAAAAKQQIIIGANNVVTVSVCWQAPQETTPHNFVATAQIQG